MGRVDSLPEFYGSIDAAIVPIDHGGGIKAKAVEAMAHGIPLFGTPHVVSGFDPEWADYIAPVDRLFDMPAKLPPSPARTRFDRQFSQDAFTNVIKRMLIDSGKL
ncbi:hypothetical protein NtRootA4_28940 [Arthrobacter sp. NtRootA4]|nr:hypothetical protein NtRootA2_31130 [Arthrobacter sp. NtRootA2]BCW15915.1 hypothetical protein NtRootA4_28940 [Arthrobacter sp. NtRootA4]BCW24248.1 hypothetical protein NtRootC7_31150 [Arthrobacter sp. NtRootC7]BCW28516.1 hypothetical protein NtRootC45_31160 [Arthrobacter sp. NtRootC45]BCW32787.1 hypothetical protein NtRootD5_31180 [Arthrobacter sp. NtRootD5]